MERITIEGIIACIKKAIKQNLYVYSSLYEYGEQNDFHFEVNFTIRNKNEVLTFNINDNNIYLNTSNAQTILKYKLDEREKLNLKSVHLDVEEYNREKAIHKYETFFNEIDKPADINDLDNEDD